MLGGGVHNLGRLTIDGSTIEGNAATGEAGDYGRGRRHLQRRRPDGRAVAPSRATTRSNTAARSTTPAPTRNTGRPRPSPRTRVAYNLASRLPDQHVVAVRSTGLDARIRCRSCRATRCASRPRTARLTRSKCSPWQTGSLATPSTIEVPPFGLGLSVPLICTTTASVTVPYSAGDPRGSGVSQTLTLEVSAPGLDAGRRIPVPDRQEQHLARPLDRLQQRRRAALRAVRG